MAATKPPTHDPAEDWAVNLMTKVDVLTQEVAALAELVKSLNNIAHKTFDKMLEVLADNARLKEEQKALEARVTLLEGQKKPDA